MDQTDGKSSQNIINLTPLICGKYCKRSKVFGVFTLSNVNQGKAPEAADVKKPAGR